MILLFKGSAKNIRLFTLSKCSPEAFDNGKVKSIIY